MSKVNSPRFLRITTHALLLFTGMLLVCAGNSPAFGQNRVHIESRAFAANAVACSIGVYISNDVSITGIVLPFEFRSVSGGAYLASQLFFNLQPGSRLYESPLSATYSPAAGVTTRRYTNPAP